MPTALTVMIISAPAPLQFLHAEVEPVEFLGCELFACRLDVAADHGSVGPAAMPLQTDLGAAAAQPPYGGAVPHAMDVEPITPASAARLFNVRTRPVYDSRVPRSLIILCYRYQPRSIAGR